MDIRGKKMEKDHRPILKEIPLKEEDVKGFKQLNKTESIMEHYFQRMMNKQAERHQKFWKKIIKKYSLDDKKNWCYNSEKKTLLIYAEPEKYITEILTDMAMKMILKAVTPPVNLKTFGIDMVE